MALNVLIFWNYSLTDMFLVCVVPCTWFILRWWCIHHAVIRSCRVKCLSDVTGSSAVRRRDVNVSVSSLPVVGALPSMFGGFLCLLILHFRSYVLMLLLVLCCTDLSHRSQSCLSWQSLRYTALGTGCAPLLQCLGRLSLPPSMRR